MVAGTPDLISPVLSPDVCAFDVAPPQDLLESPQVLGLGFLHFALQRTSPEAQAILQGRRTRRDANTTEAARDEG